MLQSIEGAHGVAHLIVGVVPVYLLVGEVVEGLVAAYFLPVVDERHTIERVVEHGKQIFVVAIFCRERLVVLVIVLIVVGDVEHTCKVVLRRIYQRVGCVLQGRGRRAVAYVHKVGLERPCIVVTETNVDIVEIVVPSEVRLGQELNLLVPVVAELADGVLPIGVGDSGAGNIVAAVAIDIGLVNPEFQAVGHGVLQRLVAVVQLVDVAIAVRMNHLAVAPCIVVGMLRHPAGICGGVVGHPVEPDKHIEFVGSRNKIAQVCNRAVGGVHLLEVSGCIGAVEASATRVDGHEPHNIDTERLEFAESLLGSGECSLLCERTYVHLVDYTMACRSLR